MNISPIANVNFGASIVYKNRYIEDKQDQTTDIIRAHLEEQFGPQIFYYNQLEKEKTLKIAAKHYFFPREAQRTKKKKDVNLPLLKEQGIYSFCERRKNELYTGAQLSNEPEKLKALKKAGINSVVSLVIYQDYEQNAKEAGLNFTDIFDLGNSGLNVFDIRENLIKQLINHPDLYADEDIKGKIAGLKEFVNVLNGKSKDFPPPVYFGCQLGTDRTFLWYQLYQILKDEPQDKPLSPDVVEQLVKYSQEVEECFRW